MIRRAFSRKPCRAQGRQEGSSCRFRSVDGKGIQGTCGIRPARRIPPAGSGPLQAEPGLLLAGAIAFYTLLSIIPMLILILIVLSHFMDPEQLIGTMSTFLELAVPGYAAALTSRSGCFFVTAA